MPKKHYWEKIDECTHRMKVFGGWVVQVNFGDSTSVTFVPDQNHHWKLGE